MAFLGRPPDQAGAEDLRRYQLHMRSAGFSATSMNAAVSALRFFFGVTLDRENAQTGMTTVRELRKLPVVLSPAYVARLLDAAPGLKYRAALSVAYGAGLRASEVVSLKVSDMDSGRMVIRVEQGIRHYGLFADGARAENLARVRALLDRPTPIDQGEADLDQSSASLQPCPCCGGPMIVIDTFEPGHAPRAPAR